jgi:hypothetical protein
VLESGGCLIESMAASDGQNMYGNYYADRAPLLLAIIHEENYSPDDTVNRTKCIYYVFDVEDTFDIPVSKSEIWYLVLSNPCQSIASYEYTWAARTATDLIIDLICLISLPLFIILIIIQIAFIKKGNS